MNILDPYILAYENEMVRRENQYNAERGKPFNLQEISADLGNSNNIAQPKLKYVVCCLCLRKHDISWLVVKLTRVP